MRLGMLPGQQRALQRAFKKADKFDHFRSRTRRAFVGGGIAAIAAAATTFWVGMRVGGGRTTAPDATTKVPPRQPLARKLAAASDADLLRAQNTFLQKLELAPEDSIAWIGFRRLAGMAGARNDRVLAARLLLTLNLAREDSEVGDLAADLRQLAK